MSMVMAGIAGANAVRSASMGITSSILNYKMQKQALDFAKKQQVANYKYAANATQIKAKDMEKAGLSKTLAAGGSAAMPAPVSMPTPQLQGMSGGILGGLISTASALQGLEAQKAQTEQLKAQTNNTRVQTLATRRDSNARKLDYDLRSRWGGERTVPYMQSVPGRALGGGIDIFTDLSKTLRNLAPGRKP